MKVMKLLVMAWVIGAVCSAVLAADAQAPNLAAKTPWLAIAVSVLGAVGIGVPAFKDAGRKPLS